MKKSILFLNQFFHRFLTDFGPHFDGFLGPSCFNFASNCCQVGPKFDQFDPKLAPSRLHVDPSWHQVGTKLAQVGPSWPQFAPKAQQDHQKVPTGPPKDPQVGAQNGAKIDKKSLENLFDFLFLIFGQIWEHFWVYFGSQHATKINQKSIQILIFC